MAGHGEKLSRKMEQAIAALLSAPTISEAAKIAGIGERTLLRWMKDPLFSNAYRAARCDTVSFVIGRLQQASADAIDTLVKRARGYLTTEEYFERTPDGTRIRVKKIRKELNPDVAAAKAILELSLKGHELENLEARIKSLELANLGDRNR